MVRVHSPLLFLTIKSANMDDNKQVGKTLPENSSQEKFTKKLSEAEIFVIKCPKCEGVHFRHAGYIEAALPFVSARSGESLSIDSLPVKICVACKSAHVVYSDKLIDVTENIDMKAWIKTEKEAQEATGPGGQC